MLRSMVDIAREECLKQSRCKVEKYCDSMLKFGASDTDINRVTGSLVEMNNELADLLHGIELLEEKLKELKETDMEQKLLHFKEIGGILEETSSKENASAECDMDAVSKSEPKSWSDNQMQSSRRRYSFLVSQLKKSLRLVETGEFILIPSKTRGRIGRLELNQEYEKLKGRWYIALNELLVRFTSKEKISWKFALPCLLYLKRLEELRMDDNNVFIAAIL
ncbi:hypothetical protein DINM_020237 [Dirofilaria immitis]|nr:hypothetical protein [Dirofilaria immitis]